MYFSLNLKVRDEVGVLILVAAGSVEQTHLWWLTTPRQL
jgi:hypothetical protein